ncbi:hypothetical protein Shyhy01_35910 [Streptomyces hygroscopicus subsp. hygroscopicus]|nr:hypothetical protein Shyhy01_35910 [Streptomyces hygroscopicus subsp. hygroscopicus]
MAATVVDEVHGVGRYGPQEAGVAAREVIADGFTVAPRAGRRPVCGRRPSARPTGRGGLRRGVLLTDAPRPPARARDQGAHPREVRAGREHG